MDDGNVDQPTTTGGVSNAWARREYGNALGTVPARGRSTQGMILPCHQPLARILPCLSSVCPLHTVGLFITFS